MKAPVSWIKEYVDLPDSVTTEALTDRLTALGLKLEALESADITGPLVIGRVLTQDPEPQKNGKVINWCTVDVGDANGTGAPQGIICGAHNFGPGDLVVVCLPGAVLPGGFAIAERKTYGHISAGMICSARELGLSDEHEGIIVLPEGTAQPGDDAFELLGLDEEVIEFEINPDRAYALSLRGVAREAALGFEAPFTDPAEREVPEIDGKAWDVDVQDVAGCPVFAARLVSGFNPSAPTPDWMSRRLEQSGMRSISLAVDITNYVMLELGQPIHGYDADKVAGGLAVRRAGAGEKLETLDGTLRALDVEDLVIADDSGVIGLAGVMGGASTEISGTTTRVLVEAANWQPVSMFRTGRRHKLNSEAGKRNERGVDPLLPGVAADRVVELLVEFGGATAEPGFTVVGSAAAREPISIAADLPARITGMEISAGTTVANLRLIGAEVVLDGDVVTATPPTWRVDINDPYDLVEEVARIVGYESVPSVLPQRATGRGLTRAQKLRRRIGRSLAGAGLSEIVAFPFVGEATFDALGLDPDDHRRDVVQLANPLSSEDPSYTTTLLPGVLKAAARNLGRGANGVALFETAPVAIPAHQGPSPIYGVDRRPTPEELDALLKTLPAQPLHLGVVFAGQVVRDGWDGAGRDAEWSDAVAVVRRLAADLSVALDVRGVAYAPWHPGRCAEFSIEGKVIGHAGELHPTVCRNFGLPARAAVAEIDLDALIRAVPDAVRAPEFSTMPVAKEDVALLVDTEITVAAVDEALRDGAGELLESLRLFDTYVGEQLGAGKKSLAFALRFRATDRTLTAEETAAARDAAVARAAELTGAVQR
ncbi:phenylalanine--tRNA ligase beta subunit [Nocardioides baekrokdamisoli]|uniref:Phenylalanine--tRNA ligase beta subunit n=1 Tax=Nocardioides baekrokdamisoli TaxID=1804624 RepID=A0A3G9J145_9ACTN|nr:phenylalanine--tRNA ligase subunit beta [Nocardioides baekrokdamisoli]BBH18363.1 phenylalanine--tRNA ligase beta subunit [Nocardioides baekrokdamisoli]